MPENGSIPTDWAEIFTPGGSGTPNSAQVAPDPDPSNFDGFKGSKFLGNIQVAANYSVLFCLLLVCDGSLFCRTQPITVTDVGAGHAAAPRVTSSNFGHDGAGHAPATDNNGDDDDEDCTRSHHIISYLILSQESTDTSLAHVSVHVHRQSHETGSCPSA